jgi:hypothetical protein
LGGKEYNTCGKIKGAYIVATIESILFTTMLVTTILWTVGIGKIWGAISETGPWVEGFGWSGWWFLSDEIRDFFSEEELKEGSENRGLSNIWNYGLCSLEEIDCGDEDKGWKGS